MKFLNFIKIVVGIPFFAVIGVFTALFCFVLDSFFTSSQNPQKEQHKQDLNERKQQYKKDVKPIVIDDLAQYLSSSLSWEDEQQFTPINQKQRQQKKALAKRRKRKKLAKKSRQQNRKKF
ncbi:hypothetical protein [Aureispira sp. CCB-QB1]|uniref:hypothetical protein n=1 Tax=Aureispira sp. CCB-QB1 TaxID=1313421 RepID=UPI000696C528|nr:hypothetical protein [Aureispira sp. CCB-QB1]